MLKRYACLFFFVLTLSVCSTTSVYAQRKKISVDQVLNTGSQGTEFYFAIPPNEILPFPVEGLEIYVASAFDTNVELFD